MAIPFLNNINLSDNELQNAKLHKTSSTPTSAEGQIYFHTTGKTVNVHSGSSWETVAFRSWVTSNFNDYTLPVATNSALGGVKIGYTESGKNYPIELDGDNKAFVNVPWTDTSALTSEEVMDIAGPLVATGGTKTRISVTYDDTNNNMDFVVDATNITISEGTSTVEIQSSTGTNDSIAAATQSLAGVMTASDKTKLDGVDDSANNYSLDLTKLNAVTSVMTGSDTLTIGDSGDDTQVTIKGNLTVIGKTITNNVETVSTSSGVIFEGTAADGNDATLVSTVAGSSKTYTLPNLAGHVALFSTAPTATITSTPSELNILDGATVTTSELNILDGVTSTASELNILDGVTSTTAELNILDGVTSTTAELNILDGVTATASEINLLDGVTSLAHTGKKTKKISGDGTETTFSLSHGLNNALVSVEILDYGNNGTGATYERVFADVTATSGSETSSVDVSFGSAPSATQDYVVLISSFPAIS